MQISFQQWFVAILRHRRLAVLVFCSVMALAVLVIVFAPREYTSEARVMLRIGRESVSVDPTASTVGDQLSLQNTRANEIQTAVGVMQSREIVDRVVDEVGADVVLSGRPMEEDGGGSSIGSLFGGMRGIVSGVIASLDPVPDHERATKALSEGVYIESTSESSVVTIAYTTKSPEVAQQIVASWVDNFITQHAKANYTEGSFQFFSDQGDLLRERLEKARHDLESIKSKSNLVTVAGQQKLLEAQLAKVRDGLLDTETEMSSVQSRLGAYDRILSESESMITSAVTGKMNEGRDLMRNRLFDLEVLEKDLESKFQKDHPKLVSIRNQLQDARNIVDTQDESREEITQAANPSYQQLVARKLVDKAALVGLEQKRQKLLEQRDEVLNEIGHLNGVEREVEMLESEVAILQGRYSDHAIKMEQARMHDVLAKKQITSVNVVQPATLQMRPVSPNKPVCAVMGFIAAMALALSLPMLIETTRTASQVSAVKRSSYDEYVPVNESLHEVSSTELEDHEALLPTTS
ncbi:Chain length determinant protein [Rubripirellula amarantea]|uniref:Chain length determinant protein n=1 Tax=Rubripirellula amarantea TaxID=2527999 RepID=A0A5C5WVE5_9BACT|nr:Wzz/FepE/Etk N-terminal domain-containing protein [Rubripirellula amarantea]TWT54101.1 Chain length determinant protein [Rubripirellula amarantea]